MSAASRGSSRPAANGTAASPSGASGRSGSPIVVTSEGDTVVLAVGRRLDDSAGAALLEAANAALTRAPVRVDIDLRGLESYTDDGARALVACRDLGARLPGGLHYRTDRGPGREALLAAYAEDGADDA